MLILPVPLNLTVVQPKPTDSVYVLLVSSRAREKIFSVSLSEKMKTYGSGENSLNLKSEKS